MLCAEVRCNLSGRIRHRENGGATGICRLVGNEEISNTGRRQNGENDGRYGQCFLPAVELFRKRPS